MAKHRRFSDTPEPDSVQKDEKIELVEQEIPSKEISTNIKSILLSGTKYVYIIAAVALLSGIFTPLTVGEEFETVVFGMLSVFLGLGGGIMIFLATKNQKFRSIMICGGLGMMIASLILIYELADRPLF
jgi:cytochrome c biogenesis factor